ncbi:CG33286 [Drosophila busckii]|uniref:CG33286 n=1 Tax=Drosophila busckii TaxID=30019 RepID=A0A0M3QWP1_DROBS|nr:CG33286 [Drosophila busckii]
MVRPSGQLSAESANKAGLLTEKDMREREQRYMQRLQDISVSCNLIKDATDEFNKLEEQRAHREHWDHHIRCDGLPRPYIPPEMRTFLERLRHYQQFDVNHSIDWTMNVDERTLLTQDIFRTDKSRRHVKVSMDDHIGERFQKDIYMYLNTLRKIDIMLDNNAEMARVAFPLQMEIMEVRREIERELDACIDRLTYRIIRMDSVYMNSSDAIVAKWGFKCDKYAIDIWSLRNVPIRFNELPAPAMLAVFSCAGVRVQMPLSVLRDCLTVRCVHTDYDTYSQYAKSFDEVITADSPNVDINAGVVDIEDCLINEWLMQLDIQEELLNNMIQRREAYEEIMQIINERTEKANKEKKSGDDSGPKIVIPKAPKEPPLVLPGLLPDAYPTFLEREHQQYMDLLDEVYHPRKLRLASHEINMREHIILGGIFSLMFVRQMPNTHFQKFNIVLHENGRVLYTMLDVVADVLRDSNSSRLSRLSRRKSRLELSQLQEGPRKTLMLEDEELPYFFVTIELPRELCLWEMENVFRPTLVSLLRHSRLAKPEDRILPLRNFSLDQRLNQIQIRKIVRYCVPRIISSFKFPLEVKEDRDAMDTRPKNKNMLIRRRSLEAEETQVAVRDINFDFDVQHQPERLFPIFADVEHVYYPEHAYTEHSQKKESIYGILEAFDMIKMRYQTDYSKVMHQKEFTADLKKSKKHAPAQGLAALQGRRQPSVRGSKFSVHSASIISSHRTSSASNIGEQTSVTSNIEAAEAPTERNTFNIEEPEEKPKIEVVHWTTKHILSTHFDREAKIMRIKTDRLGNFGLAFKRYEHFPFRDWIMQPNEDNPDEIMLKVDTFHVRVFLYITNQGIRGYATDISKGYVAHPVKYMEIIEPIADFRLLRQKLCEKNINIFAQNDACFYITNGYFSIKHLALEDHTYDAMALHCKTMKFYRSGWNRLSSLTMRITPDNTTFVEVSELCSDDLDVIKLDFKLTWRNIGHYTDLHQAICSMSPSASDARNRDAMLLYYIKKMLNELHVMSFS